MAGASDTDQRRQFLAHASAQEARGNHEAAAQNYERGGALEDAARLYLLAGRHLEAGRALQKSIGYERGQTTLWSAAQRGVALKAAICFGRGGDLKHAVDLYLALGERVRAVELLKKAGDVVNATRVERSNGPVELVGYAESAEGEARAPLTLQEARGLEADGKRDAALAAYARLRQHADAGRVAAALGRMAEAAAYYLQGGLPFEAGLCYRQINDAAQALKMMVQVPREHPRYREACVNAVWSADEIDEVDFRLDNLVGKYMATGPQSEDDVDAFYRLAALYQRHGMPDSARECLRKLVAKRPGYRDSEDRLRALDAASRGSAEEIGRIHAEEAAFLALAEKPAGSARPDPDEEQALPELPDLPKLPDVSGAGSASSRAASPARGAPAPRPHQHLTRARPHTAAPGVDPLARDAILAPPKVSPVPEPAAPAGGAAAVAPQVGVMINGRYRLEKKIGQGGMGAVFRATDIELEEVVAIKFLSLVSTEDGLLQRFKQEVSLSRQFNHPNIIRLYDLGSFGDNKFISMEFLSGRDLSKVMSEKAMELDRGLGYLVQACAALQAVHDVKVIHRDIKPENFFVTDEGVVKVMDFGISKRHDAGKGLTRAGMMAGTPQYMAPEQINDFGSVTHLADIYSLGIIAYQMFTGVVPFDNEELMPILVAHMTSEPEAPSKRNPKIPVDLEDVILRLLAKKPADRMQSCREVGEALAGIRSQLGRAPGR